MPRTPTPPRLHPPAAESIPKKVPEEESEWTEELALDDLPLGDDPHPSPFERITMVPAVPEQEYVDSMMRRDAAVTEVAPPPSSERTRTPRTGVTQVLATPTYERGKGTDDDSPEIEISGGVSMTELMAPAPRSTGPDAPLTLDLFDPVLPAPVPFSIPPRTSSIPPWPSEPPPAPPDASSLPPRASSQPPRQSGQPPRGSGQPPRASAPVPTSSRPPERFGENEPQTARRPSLTFGAATGDALELVTVRASSSPPAPAEEITIVQIRDRFEVGDFSGALVMAEALLEVDPENAEALLFAEHCRDVLKRMYLSRLGGVKRVPRIVMARDQQRWLSLDHRAGFVLSLVDGTSSIDEVLDISGMPELDALRILVELLQQNVIKVG
jgi:hypothetical protein